MANLTLTEASITSIGLTYTQAWAAFNGTVTFSFLPGTLVTNNDKL